MAYGLFVKSSVAISALEELKVEAEANPDSLLSNATREMWRAKVMSVLEMALGKDEQILSAFSAISYGVIFYTSSTPRMVFDNAIHNGILQALGQIDAAIYKLNLMSGEEDVLSSDDAVDAELLAHVRGLMEDQDWGKVASQVAIFVENHFRTWTGHPRSKTGEELVGKALFAQVLGKESEYRLGNQAGEWEGWLFLGMGFAQALSNVNRHHIHQRDDGKRYALGILGLGSLLLTQLRFQHRDRLKLN